MPASTTARVAAASLVLALGARQALAQVYHFDDIDVPHKMTLHTQVLYYIRSVTGEGKGGPAKVTFQLSQITSDGSDAGTNHEFSGLQAHVTPLSNIDKLHAEKISCAALGSSNAGKLRIDAFSGASYDIKGPKESTLLTVDLPQSKSDVYVLVFSNCGSVDHEGIKVVGTVSVRNAHGYLPAHDYPKRVFYAVMVVCYTVASFVWAVAAIKWWSTLLYIQKGILFVGILGLIENLSFLILYEVWNQSGIYSVAISMVATLCYAWKLGTAFHVLLSHIVSSSTVSPAAAGEMIMSDDCKLSIAVALYVVAEFNAKTIQSYRLSRELKVDTIILNSAPAFVLALVLYVWANVSLLNTTTALKERGEQQATVYFRSHVLVVVSMIGGGLAVLVELLDPTSADPDSWSSHWVCADGVRQLAFLVIFVGAQVVWFPSDATVGYSYQPTEGGQAVEAIGAALDDPEELGEGSSLVEAKAKAKPCE